jgi:hypothetical protein
MTSRILNEPAHHRAQPVDIVLQRRGDRVALRANGHDGPLMPILRVWDYMLTLPSDADFRTFVAGNTAHEATVIESLPHGVKLLTHRIIDTRSSIVLFEIKYAVIAPRHSCLTARADHLIGVVVEILLNDDASAAAVTRTVLQTVELVSGHSQTIELKDRNCNCLHMQKKINQTDACKRPMARPMAGPMALAHCRPAGGRRAFRALRSWPPSAARAGLLSSLELGQHRSQILLTHFGERPRDTA